MKVLLVVLLATAVASQLIAPLIRVDEPIPGRYIVKLKEGRKLDDVAFILDGAKILRTYKDVFSGFAADLSDHLVERLRKSDAVEFIKEDGMSYASAVGSRGPFDPECGGTFDSPSGTFTSPNYPENYPTDVKCEYLLSTTDETKTMYLTFDDFNIDLSLSCMEDSLYIYDGSTIWDPLLVILCGDDLPGAMMSTGRNLLLVFRSDWWETAKGFSASYQAVASGGTGCGGQFDSPSGTFTSPHYPANYHKNMNCEYLVSTTDENKVMQLSFEVFDIESDRLCGQDSLTVYDGTSTSDPRLAILCRDTIPESLLSTGRSLFLVFKSDHYGSGQGFSASYQAVESGGGY